KTPFIAFFTFPTLTQTGIMAPLYCMASAQFLSGVIWINPAFRLTSRQAHHILVFNIGPYCIDSKVILAPMAGVTDRPFRQLCRSLGAGLVISEMLTADSSLWTSRKSSLRMDHTGEA